ncbi:MAG: hypothetical protein IIT58_05945 [Treponema sp.]|nr:hypothetical protein [Treponema sp.]
MEDSEYYQMMRNQYSHIIKTKTNKNFKFTEWNAHQGREDAQMLQEKCSPKREDTISDTED